MPNFAIVDSHVHLYDPTWLRYGWLRQVPKIDRRFDLTDFDRCRARVTVDKLVFAEVAVDEGLHFAEAAVPYGGFRFPSPSGSDQNRPAPRGARCRHV